MSATDRCYTQNFLKVQYIIIQVILGRKLVKKFTVTDEKIFRADKAFNRKNNSHADLRTSHAQFWGKTVSIERKTLKIKFCHKKSTLPVKKTR